MSMVRLVGASVVVACLATAASAATVTIDGRALSTNRSLSIVGPVNAGFSGTLTRDLPAGTYLFRQYGTSGGADVQNIYAFTVALDGTIGYDAVAASFFSGAGTSTLTVKGLALGVTSELSSRQQAFINVPIDGTLQSWNVHLMPGSYAFGYRTHSSVVGYNQNRVEFTLNTDGTTSVTGWAANVITTGAGSLAIHGYTLNVQTDILGYAHYVGQLVDPGVPSYSLRVLPGPADYGVRTLNGEPYPYTDNAFDFSVGTDGKVGYASSLAGFLDGAGTTTLHVRGFTVRFVTPIVGYNHGVGLIVSQTAPATDIQLVPGVYEYFVSAYTLAKGYGDNHFVFRVAADGTVTYDASLTFLRGAGTNTLYVDGVTVHVTTPLVGYNRGVSEIESQALSDHDYHLLPGTYEWFVTTYANGYTANGFDFSVGVSGAVDYDTAFDGFVHGRGTTTLEVAGYQMRFDMHLAPATTSYGVSLIQGWSRSVIGATWLIPGNYTLDAGALHFIFSVTNAGTFDYAASLDGVIYGRSTSYMTYGIPACSTNADCSGQVCNSGLCGADTQAPAIEILSLAQYTNASTTTLLGRATDNGHIATVEVNHTSVPVAADGTFEATLTLVEGSNPVEIVATDGAGNSNGLSTQTTRDTAAPEIAILSPLPGAATGDGIVDVTVRVTDAAPTSVTIDGLTTQLPAGGGTVTVTTDVPVNGINTIGVTAEDAAGNDASTAASVLVDRDAPVIASELVAGSAFGPLSGDLLPVTLHVDDVGATTVTLSTGGTYSLPRGGGVLQVTVAVHEGDNPFTVSVTNEGGHTATLQRTATYDRSAPLLALVSPADGSTSRGWIELSADSSDAITDVASVTFRVDGGSPLAASASGTAWTTSIDSRELADGAHTVTVTSTDRVGNSAETSASIVADNTVPTVTLLGPGDHAYVRGTVTLVAEAADATSGVGSLQIAVNGVVAGSCASATCSAPFDTTSLPGGAFTVTAVATDRAGNTSATAQVIAIVDNDAISHFLASPAPGAVFKTSLSLALSIDDPSFRSASCTVGGTSLGVTTDPRFHTTVDLTSQLDGALDVSCTATDAAGNVGSDAATVRVANWTETFHPQSLRLPAKGNWVTMSVRGVNAAILIPIDARHLTLRVPGGAPVVASLGRLHQAGDTTRFDTDEADECDRPSATHADLRFSRAAFSASVKAGIAAGAINPNQPVVVSLYAGDHLIGTDSIKVKP